MSSPLLKSSGWFLRPPHLTKPTEDNTSHRGEHTPSVPVPSPPPFVSPEEEFYIRKCCPVTLNHLLPDLYLTKKHDVESYGSEFDSNMRIKFEKHLDDSHRAVSCTSSTENEEDIDDTNIEGCLENDINMHILHHVKKEPCNKKLLKPHKVNYPDASMNERNLPGITLNNYSLLNSGNDIFLSPLRHAKIVPKIASEMVKSQCYDGEIQKLLLPLKNNKKIQPLQGNRDFSYTQRKRNKKSAMELTPERQNNLLEGAYSTPVPRIELDSSFSGSRLQSIASDTPLKFTPKTSQHSPLHTSRSSLCVYHRRSRSLSPFKPTSMRSRSPGLPESTDDLVFPSPHLLQLARLKREELKLEEKMLLRQRKMLEAERLKPPVDRWYEMKNYRFHQEAHRHNSYLKNESVLPLVYDRRRQLIEDLNTPDRLLLKDCNGSVCGV